MTREDEYLWVDQFRPETLSEMLLPSKYRSKFEEFASHNQIPNLFFFSPNPGSGKTSLAKVLVKQLKADYLFVNASESNGISTLRYKIREFIESASYGDFVCPHKIVILDEFDGSTDGMRDALKGFIEEYSSVCRFIATANKEMVIEGPIQSRLMKFDFSYSEQTVREEMIILTCRKVIDILQSKNIMFKQDDVLNIVLKYFPDIRNVIKIVQQYTDTNGGVLDADVLKFQTAGEDFINLLMSKDFNGARKYILDNGIMISSVYRTLYDELLNRIPKQNYPVALVTIAQYMYKHSSVIDPEINLAACLMEMVSLT